MDEEPLARLTEQVRILHQTVEAMLSRQEQVFKLHEEKLSLLEQTLTASASKLDEATSEIETTDEALKQALSEIDTQLDDLAKITAALLTLQKEQESVA
jgi:predicted DNA-binding protein YlxM (UPF0122 family)